MTTFEELMREVEHEAERAGPEAVSELKILRMHWRAELAGMQERFQRRGREFCICGISPGPAYRPVPQMAWRHSARCPHALGKSTGLSFVKK